MEFETLFFNLLLDGILVSILELLFICACSDLNHIYEKIIREFKSMTILNSLALFINIFWSNDL